MGLVAKPAGLMGPPKPLPDPFVEAEMSFFLVYMIRVGTYQRFDFISCCDWVAIFVKDKETVVVERIAQSIGRISRARGKGCNK